MSLAHRQTHTHIGDACVGDVFEGIFTAWPRKGTKFEVFKGRHEEDARGEGCMIENINMISGVQLKAIVVNQ